MQNLLLLILLHTGSSFVPDEFSKPGYRYGWNIVLPIEYIIYTVCNILYVTFCMYNLYRFVSEIKEVFLDLENRFDGIDSQINIDVAK